MTEKEAILLYKEYFFKQFGKKISVRVVEVSNEVEPLDVIANLVIKHEGQLYEDVFSDSRKRELVEVRHIIWYILLAKGYTSVRIGRVYGMDHSSILYAKGGIQDRMDTEQEFRKRVESIVEYVSKFA